MGNLEEFSRVGLGILREKLLGAEAGDARSYQLIKGVFYLGKEVGLHPIINGKPLIGLKQGGGVFIFTLWRNHFHGRSGGG